MYKKIIKTRFDDDENYQYIRSINKDRERIYYYPYQDC